MMNRFQIQATAAYAEGTFAPLAKSETRQSDVDERGDGLFRYLILELSTQKNQEYCETWTEAINRVETTIDALVQVPAALRAAYLQEKPDAHKTMTNSVHSSLTRQ